MQPQRQSDRQRIAHWLRGDTVDYGCAFCADDQNRPTAMHSENASDIDVRFGIGSGVYLCERGVGCF
jgi:hypothetical protein